VRGARDEPRDNDELRALTNALCGNGGSNRITSPLISQGLNVVFVSRQLGHANATVTLGTYAHLFGQADQAEAAREALEASYEEIAGAVGS
jgi:ABC-type Fe3+-hydroxamate transport system substrate-binding protein